MENRSAEMYKIHKPGQLCSKKPGLPSNIIKTYRLDRFYHQVKCPQFTGCMPPDSELTIDDGQDGWNHSQITSNSQLYFKWANLLALEVSQNEQICNFSLFTIHHLNHHHPLSLKPFKTTTSANWLHHVRSDVSQEHFTSSYFHILMATPPISLGISLKSFQGWERLNHRSSWKNFSSQTFCCGDLRRFAATTSKACDFLFAPCGLAGWETVSSAGLPQSTAFRIGSGFHSSETIGTEAMVSLAFQSSWNRWLSPWLWLVGFKIVQTFFQLLHIFPPYRNELINDVPAMTRWC